MNFNNIYRDNLHRQFEASKITYKNLLSKKDIDGILEMVVDEMRKLYASTLDLTSSPVTKTNLIKNCTNELKKMFTIDPKKFGIIMNILSDNELKANAVDISSICGTKMVPDAEFRNIMAFIQRLTGVNRVDIYKCFDEYKLKKQEAVKLESEKAEKLSTEFKDFYLEKRLDASTKPGCKLLDKDLYDKAQDKYNVLKALGALKTSSKYSQFFYLIDPELDWMDKTFVTDSKEFIYGPVMNREKWLSMVMAIEADIISNKIDTTKDPTAEELFKDIIEKFIDLQKQYDEIIKDNKFKNALKGNAKGCKALKAAGFALSGISIVFGAFTYALGAFIPGGAYYANILSKLALFGRRTGKLLSNFGSPLKRKSVLHDKEKHTDTDDEDSEVFDNSVK